MFDTKRHWTLIFIFNPDSQNILQNLWDVETRKNYYLLLLAFFHEMFDKKTLNVNFYI